MHNGPSRSSKSIIALYGAPGSGKTEISKHFVRRHRDDFSDYFTLHARSEEEFEKCLRELRKQIPYTTGYFNLRSFLGARSDKVFEAVVDWLSRADNKHWIVVIDNIDSTMLQNKTSQIAKLLNRVPHGNFVLISQCIGIRDFCDGSKSLRVGQLLVKETEALVEHYLGGDYLNETEGQKAPTAKFPLLR